MRTYTIIWLGQLVSTIGSYMTEFAIKVLAWEMTEKATALTLMELFSLLSGIFTTLIAGTIVDHWNRKVLIVLGDTVAILTTVIVVWLYFSHHLQVWHFYIAEIVTGAFSEIQELAYSTSTAMMVPKHHYTRASSMNSALHYGSVIIAPALAGVLYPSLGLGGIGLIDIATFGVAILTILSVAIPQVERSPQPTSAPTHQLAEALYGFRYLLLHRGLLMLLAVTLLFSFAHEVGGALYAPMLLARSGNNTTILGSISAAAGLGGMLGAAILIAGKGSEQRMQGLLLAMVGVGVSKSVFGWGQSLLTWMPAQFASSLSFPLLSSCDTAIWWSKVSPKVQGRVFAARSLIVHLSSILAVLVAGPLADHFFEPAMRPGGSLVSLGGWLFGTTSGSGMALLYSLASLCMVLVGMGGLMVRSIRNAEVLIPDHDVPV
ncbi:MAG: MFS transporter [Acaryochloris sp. RU_4_1]|nr:MFS transporter [Acaryochloris sp. RU_4_1]NJR53705.1 MFS transporter [Acaryochloris sp. CRU_2_0]